jgi:hypothetical protein
MTYPQLAALAVATAIVAWPTLRVVAGWLAARRPSLPTPAAATVKPSYSDVMDDLQSVRLRLLRTGCLNQDQRNAIDILTLALVDGSDQ